MKINKIFDKFEDKVRQGLSHFPVAYGLIGGIGLILFWRGIDLVADELGFMTGYVSLIVGGILSLATGVIIYFFVGDQIIITGMKHEKKIAEKTENEIKSEDEMLKEIHIHLQNISGKINLLSDKINKNEGGSDPLNHS